MKRLTILFQQLWENLRHAVALRACGIFAGFAILLLSLHTHAAAVAGYVVLKDAQKYIQRVGDPKLYKLNPGTIESTRNLERLTNNDFLQGQGEFQNDQFLLQTVDFVGLYHLLGAWQSPENQTLITFETYRTFSVFNPHSAANYQVSLLDYSLAPATGTDWKIFVTGAVVSIASLRLDQERLTLQFINQDTGNYVEPAVVLVRKTP